MDDGLDYLDDLVELLDTNSTGEGKMERVEFLMTGRVFSIRVKNHEKQSLKNPSIIPMEKKT